MGFIFGLVVLGFVVLIGFKVLNAVMEFADNTSQPPHVVQARVVAKRTDMASRGKGHSTDYFTTFELDHGQRIELKVDGKQYGLLAEGDSGNLSHQGSWFIGFERKVMPVPPPVPVPTEAVKTVECAYCGAVNPVAVQQCAGCGSTRLLPVSGDKPRLSERKCA